MALAEMSVLLQEMEQYAQAEHVPIINARARQLYCEAVREAKPRRLLEIGTAIGYSALLALENALPGAELVTLEQSKGRIEVAKAYWARSKFAGQLTLLEGDAGELLGSLEGQFDFVFIDAAKGQYPDYWRKIQPLLAEQATVLADNVLFRGYVRGGVEVPRRFRTITKRLREYLALVEADKSFTTEIHEDGDGLAISQRRKNFAEA